LTPSDTVETSDWALTMDRESGTAADFELDDLARATILNNQLPESEVAFMLFSEPERIVWLLLQPFHDFGNAFPVPVDMNDPRLHPARVLKDFDNDSGQFRHLDFSSFRPVDEVALDYLAASHPDGNLSSITPRPRRSAELDQEIFLEFASIPTGIFTKCIDKPSLICAHRTIAKCGFWAQCFNFKDRKSWLIPDWEKRFHTVRSFFDLLRYLERCLPLAPPQLPGCRMCRRLIIEKAVACYERDAQISRRGNVSDYKLLREY